MDRTSALSVERATVTFDGVTAVDDVTFSVPRGVTQAVIGPNGAGKTTLVNLVCGLEAGTGVIRLGDVAISGLRPDRRAAAGLARSFQTPILCPDLGVLDNIRVGAPRAAARDAARVRELLDALGIEAPPGAPVDTLTHRDRRLVEIARALLRGPSVLILDEPAAGLGQAEADSMMAAVVETVSATGGTIVIIEHNMDLISTWADRVLVLDRGRVLAEGTPREIRADAAVVEAYLGGEWS
ncbi:ATP-binding cassette domain-containing protein [Streptomyces sp. DSM 44917]|uniref:ATP-binding cassette domain-containing protein n=1 Tax=Streptomyces boetiae TaxID=3075541 RepID=A0ABU2L7Y7_9ACTN|nr:ATP-binding cassette domain-containing protein [Streptomyces sp. DSM 44917]MDT0307328.1 ATP-binding cassette domain-containing protein [Streptomyces sp. DSM 44917]